jgi:hypothetical protein
MIGWAPYGDTSHHTLLKKKEIDGEALPYEIQTKGFRMILTLIKERVV